MTCLNCGCQTRKSELTRRTWLRRHILRLWLHPMLPSSGSLFYLCVCLCVCHCSGFTPGEDRQLLCGGEDAGEGQPISRRATETAPVWSECQHKTGHLLLPPLDETRAIAGHTNTHSHSLYGTDSMLGCFRSWSALCLWRRITGRSGPSPSTTLTTAAKLRER